MLQKIRNRLNNRKGFTLIELIVVIVIIGILAAIVIPRLSSFQQSAKVKADVATAKSIQTAVAALNSDDPTPVTGTKIKVSTNTQITAKLQSTPVVKSQTGDFYVDIVSDDITVYIWDGTSEKGTEMIPTQGAVNGYTPQ